MKTTIVVVWLGAQGSFGGFDANLDSWAAARGVYWDEPEEVERPFARSTRGLGDRIEKKLDEARNAAVRLDERSATEALVVAERMVRAHPELPEAAWLLAERWRVEAEILHRADPGDARARELSRRALVLEGERAPIFGATPEEGEAPTVAKIPVQISGVTTDQTTYVDGHALAPKPRLAPGEHHVRVLDGVRVVWAGFIVLEASGDLAIPARSTAPCTTDDLAGARVRDGAPTPRAGTRCERWAIARPAAARGIEIATCAEATCGAFVTWRLGAGASYTGPPQPPETGPSSAWGPLFATGLGLVLAVTVAALASDSTSDAAERPRRIYEGPKFMGIGF